jgi:DNA-binding MarR family transcriptional regulator
VGTEAGKSGRADKAFIDAGTAKIIAAKGDEPDASERDVARITGLPKSTVHDKLKRLEESEPIQAIRRGIITLLPQAKKVYTQTLADGPCPHCNGGPNGALRLTAARDVFKGVGIFKDHSKSENTSVPVTPDQLVDAVFALDDDQYAEFTSIFAERIRELRDSVDTAQADPASTVAGEDSTPDA